MTGQSQSYESVTPGTSNFIGGEFGISDGFSLDYMEIDVPGDLHRADLRLSSHHGCAEIRVLGRDPYYTKWNAYRLRAGMKWSSHLDKAFVTLHFQLEGALNTSGHILPVAGTLRPGFCSLCYIPASDASLHLTHDSAGSLFNIVLSPSYFSDLATRHPQLFGTYYEEMLRNESPSFEVEEVPISPQMWAVVQSIREGNSKQAAGSLFLEAQILQLLSLYVQQREQPVTRNGVRLTRPDVDRMHGARDILLRNLTDPPTLAELARRVGTNEHKLKEGFKAIFGNSPYAYLLEHKLELARSYVLDTELTIAEIAYHVGYSDPAHLTNAFRKHFGFPPTQLR